MKIKDVIEKLKGIKKNRNIEHSTFLSYLKMIFYLFNSKL